MRLGGASPAYLLPQMRQAPPLEGDIPDGRARQLEVHRGRCYAHIARYPYPLGAPFAPQGSFISLGVWVEIINDAIPRTRADCGHIVRLPFPQHRFCTAKSRHTSQLIGRWSFFKIPQPSDLTLLWNARSCVCRWVGISGRFWRWGIFLYNGPRGYGPCDWSDKHTRMPPSTCDDSDRRGALIDVRIIDIRRPTSIGVRRNWANRRNRRHPNEADEGAAQLRLPH